MLRYTAFLNSLLKEWHAQALELLGPAIEENAQRHTPGDTGHRTDGLQDKGRKAIDTLRLRLEHVFNANEIDKQTARYAKEVIGKNKKKEIIGINPLHADPGLTVAADIYRTNNVLLIKSIPDRELREVQALLEKPSNFGRRVEEMRDLIQERFSVSESRAALIARDQTLKLNSQITKTRQTRAGISRYVWTTSGDERVRGQNGESDNHYDLDGKTFAWNDPPVVDEKTGRRCHPGEDYQCRCVAFPVVEELDTEEE